jgi:Tol biopolymer transport system component
MDSEQDVELYQSCGKENHSGDEKCAFCGALMPGVLKQREEARQVEAVLDSLPESVAGKIRKLEEEHERRPDAVAVCIQLSNLYKDAKLIELAVDYMEKASVLDPDNKFLQQKLRLLVDGEAPDISKVLEIDRSQAATRRGSRFIFLAIGVVVLIALAVIALRFLFPSSVRFAKGEGGYDAISPRFSADGSRIAYLQAPRFSLTDALSFIDGGEPEKDSWLMVKPIKGEPVKLAQVSRGRVMYLAFAWRPRHDEITFASWGLGGDYSSGMAVYSIPSTGGEPKLVVKGQDFAWSRDGRLLAFSRPRWYGNNEGGMYVLDPEAGTETRIMNMDCEEPSWSSASDDLVFQCKDWGRFFSYVEDYLAQEEGEEEEESPLAEYIGDLYRYDAGTGQATQVTSTGAYRFPRFIPGGSRIAALTYGSPGSYENDLVTMDLYGQDVRILLSPGKQYEFFGDFSFSPDGKTVAFEGFSPNPQVPPELAAASLLGTTSAPAMYLPEIYLAKIDGTGLEKLTEGKHQFKSQPRFSPDGKWLAYEIMYFDFRREIWAMKAK